MVVEALGSSESKDAFCSFLCSEARSSPTLGRKHGELNGCALLSSFLSLWRSRLPPLPFAVDPGPRSLPIAPRFSPFRALLSARRRRASRGSVQPAGISASVAVACFLLVGRSLTGRELQGSETYLGFDLAYGRTISLACPFAVNCVYNCKFQNTFDVKS